ncbi:MAG: hypothetical protein OEV16_16435, partial [Gammaproteobacteria bacterium]|nr:hypothetical protein [Gammaproteobacteria bacterium]
LEDRPAREIDPPHQGADAVRCEVLVDRLAGALPVAVIVEDQSALFDCPPISTSSSVGALVPS